MGAAKAALVASCASCERGFGKGAGSWVIGWSRKKLGAGKGDLGKLEKGDLGKLEKKNSKKIYRRLSFIHI